MHQLTIAKKLHLSAIPSFMEEEFIDAAITHYEEETFFLCQYGHHYDIPLPSIEGLADYGSLDELFRESASAKFFGDRDYFRNIPDKDYYEDIVFNEMFSEEYGIYLDDVTRVYNHFQMSYHTYDDIVNKPIVGVW